MYFTLQSNSTKYNKPFGSISWPNLLEGHHIHSSEIWGKTFTGWFKKCSDGYLFSIWNKRIHFSLPLNSEIHKMGSEPNILCYWCEEREEFHTHFLFYCKLSKTSLDFISEVTNLIYITLIIPFKISPKAIIMEASSQFHAAVQLHTPPALLEVFISYLSYSRRKAFHDHGYDTIYEIFNFKCKLNSRLNKLRDTTTRLDSKETFLKNWTPF